MTIDLFHNVHKGIRRALFEATMALGRGEENGRALLRDALHFTAHHGENEDLLLVPLLEARLPSLASHIRRSHASIDHELHALRADVEGVPLAPLYARNCVFIAHYLEHLEEEEEVIDPAIRAAYPEEELAFFGAQSVARTKPQDASMMLRAMLPALPEPVARDYLAKLPTELADELRVTLGRVTAASAPTHRMR